MSKKSSKDRNATIVEEDEENEVSKADVRKSKIKEEDEEDEESGDGEEKKEEDEEGSGDEDSDGKKKKKKKKSKDKKDGDKKDKGKKGEKRKSKEHAVDDLPPVTSATLPENNSRTISSVSQELDDLSNYLARTFPTFGRSDYQSQGRPESMHGYDRYNPGQSPYQQHQYSPPQQHQYQQYQQPHPQYNDNYQQPYTYNPSHNDNNNHYNYTNSQGQIQRDPFQQSTKPKPSEYLYVEDTAYGSNHMREYHNEGRPEQQFYGSPNSTQQTRNFHPSTSQPDPVIQRPRHDFSPPRVEKQSSVKPEYKTSNQRYVQKDSQIGPQGRVPKDTNIDSPSNPQSSRSPDAYYNELYGRSQELTNSKKDIRELYKNKPRHMFVEASNEIVDVHQNRSATTKSQMRSSDYASPQGRSGQPNNDNVVRINKAW